MYFIQLLYVSAALNEPEKKRLKRLEGVWCLIFYCLTSALDEPETLNQLPGRLADRRCVQGKALTHRERCGKNAEVVLKPSESPRHNGIYAIMPRGLYTAG